jgi:hypothetical protein
MPSTLAEVSDDVLLNICHFLEPRDLKAFDQTSRRHHAIVQTNLGNIAESHWRASLECKDDFDAFLAASIDVEPTSYFYIHQLYEDFVTMAEDVMEFWESPECKLHPDLHLELAIFMPSFTTALSASLRLWRLFKLYGFQCCHYHRLYPDPSKYPAFVELVWKEHTANDIADICTLSAMFSIWCRMTANEYQSRLGVLVGKIDDELRISGFFKGIAMTAQETI